MVNTTKMKINILHHGSQHEHEQRMDCLFFEYAFVSFSCREQSNSPTGKKIINRGAGGEGGRGGGASRGLRERIRKRSQRLPQIEFGFVL